MTPIDISSWVEFRIDEVFKISRPSTRSLTKYVPGDVPFIASGNFNNGVSAYVEPKRDEVLDPGNCITVSPLDGSAFYQPDDFLGRGGAGSAIIMLRNPKLSTNNGLFIATAVRKSLTHFNYSDQLNKESIAVQLVKLPVKNGEPDWGHMDRVMSIHVQQQLERLDVLQSLLPVATDKGV